MPGKQITPDQISRYLKLRAEGWTKRAACQKTGISERTAERHPKLRDVRGATTNRGEQEDLASDQPLVQSPVSAAVGFNNSPPIPDPLRRSELSAIALDCLEDFGRFRYRYFGRISSPWQEDAAVKCATLLSTPVKEYLVVNAPPGGGKSTLFTHDIDAWLTARSRSLRGFIGSSTQTTANSYTGRLRSTLERPIPMEAKSEELAMGLAVDAQAAMCVDYGRFKPIYVPDQSNPPWSKSQFTVEQFGQTLTDEKEATWTAFGEDTKFLGWRVNFIVWDDLVTAASFRTLESRDSQRRWWINEAETRLEPGGLLVLQGQRLSAEDLYRFCLDMDRPPDNFDWDIIELGEEVLPTEKKYHHIVYKAHYEEICKADTDPRAHSPRNAPYNPSDPDAGGCLLDPVRLPWRELKVAMDQPLTNYRVVYQQEDVDPDEVLIPRVWIDGGRDPDGVEFDGCWDTDRGIGQVPRHLNAPYCVSSIEVDPSPSNYWSIQWWLYSQPPKTPHLGGMRYLIDMYRGPLASSDFLDYITETGQYAGLFDAWVTRARNLGFPIQYLIFEVNAAQKFVQQYNFFRIYMQSHGVMLRPHTTGINKSDDEFGIRMLRPQYKFGRIRLPGTYEAKKVIAPLVTELTRYPDCSTDDCVMANWFHEFNLQHLVRKQNGLPSTYNDIPSWVRQAPV